ncbi:MAG: hypothetical protein ACFFDY_07375 [Candidatus Thorarchaeota archaeon]
MQEKNDQNNGLDKQSKESNGKDSKKEQDYKHNRREALKKIALASLSGIGALFSLHNLSEADNSLLSLQIYYNIYYYYSFPYYNIYYYYSFPYYNIYYYYSFYYDSYYYDTYYYNTYYYYLGFGVGPFKKN